MHSSATPSIVPLPIKKPKIIKRLPEELWLGVLECLSVSDLLVVRSLSRKWKSMSNLVLSSILESRFIKLSYETEAADAKHKESEGVRLPLLAHYRDFLLVPTIHENLTEVVWYSNAPFEVQAVAECLVRLKGGVNLPDEERMPWSELRRIMKRADFKMWISSLSTNIEKVDYHDALQVEQIIRVEPLITYERLRDVSMAGYRLLILVAASLQYATIGHELRKVERTAKLLTRSLDKTRLFMAAIAN